MWAFSSAGRAPPWHGGGHRFDPDKVHQLKHIGRQSPAFFVFKFQALVKKAVNWGQFKILNSLLLVTSSLLLVTSSSLLELLVR